jgi:transcriptional regulator with XRE-family HTH domain
MTNRLSAIRQAHGLSQIKLARILDVSEATIIRWEKNYIDIPHKELIRLAGLFGIAPKDIVPEYDMPPPSTEEPARV